MVWNNVKAIIQDGGACIAAGLCLSGRAPDASQLDAKPVIGAHALIEKRKGLSVEVLVTDALTKEDTSAHAIFE